MFQSFKFQREVNVGKLRQTPENSVTNDFVRSFKPDTLRLSHHTKAKNLFLRLCLQVFRQAA